MQRVEPMVRFYQDRLPTYYRTRSISQLLMIIGSLSGTLMAFLDIAQWSAIATAALVSVTAWAAFHGTSRKLTRYNNTVEKVSSTILWWEALTIMEQVQCFPQFDLSWHCAPW